MLRVSVVLTVWISMVGATEDRAEAQRFTPFRNLGRPVGIGWGQGYHFRNPGPINNTYSSWSEANTAGILLPEAQGPAPGSKDLSVIRLVPEDDVIENAYQNADRQPAPGKPSGVLRSTGPLTPRRPASYLVPDPALPGSQIHPSKFPGSGEFPGPGE